MTTHRTTRRLACRGRLARVCRGHPARASRGRLALENAATAQDVRTTTRRGQDARETRGRDARDTLRTTVRTTVHAAESTAPAAAGALPQQLLNDGEVVILAVKPSVWFVLLSAWPAIAVATGVMALGYVALPMIETQITYSRPVLAMLCASAVLIQLFLSCCQWTGRLYVLTNVRVLRIRGVFRVDVFQCPLIKIRQATLTAVRLERLCGVGTIVFDAETASDEPCWLHIARPAEVNDKLQDALRRARK